MALRARIVDARGALARVDADDAILRDCAKLCVALGSDGLRGELTLLRAARALAAFEDAPAVTACICAPWRRPRCATASAAIRWTRPGPPPASPARWRRCWLERRPRRRRTLATREPRAGLFRVGPRSTGRHLAARPRGAGAGPVPSRLRPRRARQDRLPAAPRYRRRCALRRHRPCRDAGRRHRHAHLWPAAPSRRPGAAHGRTCQAAPCRPPRPRAGRPEGLSLVALDEGAGPEERIPEASPTGWPSISTCPTSRCPTRPTCRSTPTRLVEARRLLPRVTCPRHDLRPRAGSVPAWHHVTSRALAGACAGPRQCRPVR
jgi:hypothetical protein